MNYFRYFVPMIPNSAIIFCSFLTTSQPFQRKQAVIFSDRLFLLFSEGKFGTVEGCKIVAGLLCPADQLEAAVFLQQNFRAAEFTVVVVAHGETVGTGVVDAEDVANFDFRQAALNGKLRSAEVLLKEDGSFKLIRRAEKPSDYFATFDCTEFTFGE